MFKVNSFLIENNLKNDLKRHKLKLIYSFMIGLFIGSLPTINKVKENFRVQKLIEEQILNYVIQVNGKKRGLIQAEKDILVENLINLVEKRNDLKKYFVDKTIKKKIFIPNKLLNIIV